MNSNVIFKIASLDDVDAIVDLCNECFDEETDYHEARRIFEETQSDENNIYVIGKIDDRIVVAHAKITIIKTIYKDMGTYAILNHVCVKPEYRRKNIATRMLEEITEICKNHDCHIIELWSNNYRNPAHACYKKFGFIPNDATFFSKEIGGM